MTQVRAIRLRWIVPLGVALAAGIGALAWWLWFHNRPARGFQAVQPGVLYRSGQPDEAGLKEILRGCHIGTLVNLRGPHSDEAWWTKEHAVCAECGVTMADVNMGGGGDCPLTTREFLAIATDPNCLPVYIHCDQGVSRTGFSVAAYRIAVQRWTFEAAMEEAASHHFSPEIKDHPVYDRVLRLLASGADWRTWPEGVPATTCAAAPRPRP